MVTAFISNLIKAFIIGIVEGITEWLPVSSTGHMILVEKFAALEVSSEFNSMFLVVIQLGAIIAVCIVFFDKLNPFSSRKSARGKKSTWIVWSKVVVGCLPAAVLGLLFDDWIDEHLMNAYVVAATLIIYGIFFILIENLNQTREFSITKFSHLSYLTAFEIGMFQVLALIPGTSRSGATILGAMLLGVSRTVATEYSFFMSIPVMFGASLLKVVKYAKNGPAISNGEIAILIVGCLTAFVVSYYVITALMQYIRKNDFKIFGYYRIIIGVVMAAVFVVSAMFA